jgi:hypothetical protein
MSSYLPPRFERRWPRHYASCVVPLFFAPFNMLFHRGLAHTWSTLIVGPANTMYSHAAEMVAGKKLRKNEAK